MSYLKGQCCLLNTLSNNILAFRRSLSSCLKFGSSRDFVACSAASRPTKLVLLPLQPFGCETRIRSKSHNYGSCQKSICGKSKSSNICSRSGLKDEKNVKTKGRQQNQDRTAGRIGLRIGSDRIGLVFSLIVQKNYFEKSCF